MKIQTTNFLEVVCTKCARKDVKHKAKGLCVNCYRKQYYTPVAARVLVENVEPVDNDTEA